MNEQQRKAMELALEALESMKETLAEHDEPTTFNEDEAFTAIKEALAQDALQALHNENKSLGLYEKGYADAMNWKVQNHLEHLPVAQPEQEPVAWLDGPHLVMRSDWRDRANYKGPWVDLGRAVPDSWVPALYTTPPQEQRSCDMRKPLTDEQRMIEMVDAAMVATRDIVPRITRSQCRLIIEATHGIKE